MMVNRIIRYFDLQSAHRQVLAQGHDSTTPLAPVLPQYLIVSAGVIADPLLRSYISSGAWNFDLSTVVGRTLFGLIVGIILLPAVYKASFDAQKPVLIQLAALFPLGIGWQSLFTTATKIVHG